MKKCTSGLRKFFKTRGPYFLSVPSLLFLDSHRVHFTQSVEDACRAINFRCQVILPKFTPLLQPLDVSGGINEPFKQKLNEQWQDWFEQAQPEYTPSGHRKRPSYEVVLGFVSAAIDQLSKRPDVIKRLFRSCGIESEGGVVGTINKLPSA